MLSDLPSAHPELGEPLPDAAARVARTQLGVSTVADTLTHVHTTHVVGCAECRLGAFFEVSTWTGTPTAAAGVRWCDLDALPAELHPYSEAGIRAYRQGVTFGAVDWDELAVPA